MNDRTDHQLLLEYAQSRSEEAFSVLVRRHVDLVYSAALRMVCETHAAEDVTQAVFLVLAQNASRLAKHPVISGWLHSTARNLAAKAVRSEVRRRAREQEAAAMNELLSATPEAPWEKVAPQLDAALGELSDPERDAVFLRYFEKKSAPEMAEVLGVSAEAAQKRASRAVERLRQIFAKRGVTAGAGALVSAISTNAVQAAPTGLATTISAATLTGTLTSAATVAATKAIAMTTLQKTLVTAAVAVLAGVGIYEGSQASRLRDQVTQIEQRQAPLAAQMQQVQRERDEARTQLAAMVEEGKRVPDASAELLRLRGLAAVARRASAEAEQLRAQLERQTNTSSTSPVVDAMTDAMTKGLARRVETRVSRMAESLHMTPEQTRAAREILLRQAEAMSAGMQQAMTGNYDKGELTRMGKKAGNTDEQIKALLTPEQLASFTTYKQEEFVHDASMAANQELLQMQFTLDLKQEQLDGVYAALYQVTLDQLNGGSKQKFPNESDAMQWALEQKAKALEPLLTETQMQNFRKEQALQAKLMKDIMGKLDRSGLPQ